MDRRNGLRQTILICLLLGAVTLAVYWPATRGGFIAYDDNLLVTENP